ncbi:diguanylate cyclase/phosphodiesterase (GGDEF & EAL domains) with PAS/PAC sensor(s) [hydrothermal vent metagenome]|uniref:Diguanylate cyclase/phosphodiesterase (GGDEF & EAL domains) with PAS/PAC sensor(S) n=1 Tax=hydrothermal vent metagenome TaxID=652676 RepID=A0A3B0WB63_9ZZZZ
MFEKKITNPGLLEKQIEPLFKSTLSGGLGNIFVAFLVYLSLKDNSPNNFVFYFFICMALFSGIRIFISLRYLKYKKNHSYFLNSHVFLTFITGLLWGLIVYSQVNTESEILINFAFLISIGLISSSVVTLSTWLPAYFAYVLPQSFFIFYVSLTFASTYNLYITLAYLAFILTMILTGIRFNNAHKREIELTINNENLINDLNSEIKIKESVQLEFEKSKVDLENKINERTKDLINTNLHLENVILEKEKAEQHLQYIAYHDELTGLPNRNLLVDRINQSIKISARDQQQVAILFLDLDRFKSINDSLGHKIGDELLKEIPIRLDEILRSHDTVSRNGGDEFVVVLEKLNDSCEAVYAAEKIIKCLTETFKIRSHTIHIGASIGISIYPKDGNTPSILLRNADTAMYRAKQSGGRQLQFYDESMSDQLRNRLELESELHNAVENNEFYMVYQPKMDCSTGKTIGFESLVRWNNLKYGEITPNDFIPILEETGLIYEVGEWIVTEVLTFMQQYSSHKLNFSINLSALQCNNFNFIALVNDLINDLGLDSKRVEFEITESLLIKNFTKTKIFLDELHSIGISIALDDFGTGYTSMNYLTQLPIDVIKIDKSFIKNIDTNINLQSIVNAIVTMSKSLGIKNVFEGVETESELAEIKKMTGSIIQGYLYSKPLKTTEIKSWVRDKS